MPVIAQPDGQQVGPPVEYDALRDIYQTSTSVAVVGAATTEWKEAHIVPQYLWRQGYRLYAVGPRTGDLFGHPIVATLADVPETIDVVNVFRPPAEATSVTEAAIDAGARVLWFQPDTHTEEAVRLATTAGLVVVVDRCMGHFHAKLGLGAGPS